MMRSRNRRPRRVAPLCLGLLALILSLPAYPAGATQEALAWLQKITRATETLNYDGVFVYRNGDTMDTMRIIHRAGPEDERERLVALTGAEREVIRDRQRVTCILPDTKSVVVSKSRPRSLVPSPALSPDADLSRHYRLNIGPGERVAGRETRRITLQPKDAHRYAYRLWADRETGLLLKSDVLDPSQRPLEQIVYTSLRLPERIPDELLEPNVSGEGFTWYTNEGGGMQDASARTGAWRVGWVPPGFSLSERSIDPIPTSRMPVEHLWYTDGIASLSVFIEKLKDSEPLQGMSRMGALQAFGRVVDGYQVTVVGEVPARTVRAVAESVRHVAQGG